MLSHVDYTEHVDGLVFTDKVLAPDVGCFGNAPDLADKRRVQQRISRRLLMLGRHSPEVFRYVVNALLGYGSIEHYAERLTFTPEQITAWWQDGAQIPDYVFWALQHRLEQTLQSGSFYGRRDPHVIEVEGSIKGVFLLHKHTEATVLYGKCVHLYGDVFKVTWRIGNQVRESHEPPPRKEIPPLQRV